MPVRTDIDSRAVSELFSASRESFLPKDDGAVES